MMEDTATAEIARAQLWQWIRHGVTTEEGAPVTLERVRTMLREELDEARGRGGRARTARGAPAELLDRLVAAKEFPEFLTLGAYEKLSEGGGQR